MRAIPIFVLALTASACDVGEVNGPPPGVPDAHAGSNVIPGTPDAAPLPPGTPDAAPAATAQCRNAVNTADSGHHNAGQDCMAGNCHGPGGAGPLWTVAGTLYGSSAGGSILSGATITIVDGNGKTIDLVSALNGNFYTGQSVALPATVYASKCPAISQMQSTISIGSCNGCHSQGSATGRVHLP